MQLFPETIRNLWNKWEVRVMILLSLLLQIILIIFGNRRKVTARIWIRIIVWSAYLSADWVATVALGNLASIKGDSGDSTTVSLQGFWAPFLLMHLGGPDTITAYSLEDNELWLRHFLGLIIQVGVALYVFLKSWSNTALTFITIPIFISGIIKYGERTYALFSSSSQHLRDSLPSSPDSCEDFVKVVERAKVIPQDGISDLSSSPDSSEDSVGETKVIPQDGIDTEDHYLVLAYFLYKRFEFFFAEGTVDQNERKLIYSIIKDKKLAEEAFKLVEVELGFMYDVLYTKAAIVYSRSGIILRCITFFCSISALFVFSTVVDIHVYQPTDIFITYLLLVGAVLLELYALILLFLSDRARLWFIKPKKPQQNSILETLASKKPQHNSISETLASPFLTSFSYAQSLVTSSKRWSDSIGQYNLLGSCIKKIQPIYVRVQKLPFMGEWLEYKNLTWVDVKIDHLQDNILAYLKEKFKEIEKLPPLLDAVLNDRGMLVLWRKHGFDEWQSEWCTTGLEFVESLIVWHIATTTCYYGDLHIDRYSESKYRSSKYLSDYMLYLLVFRPSMLSNGIGEIRFKETCDEITTLLKSQDICSESNACNVLLNNHEALLQGFGALLEDEKDPHDFNELKGESHSLLKYGLMLSVQLQNESGRKWQIITDVWIQMLMFAAHNCGWKEHAQQLRKGGEFLTHVCLLMAHVGLSTQIFDNTVLKYTPEAVAYAKSL